MLRVMSIFSTGRDNNWSFEVQSLGLAFLFFMQSINSRDFLFDDSLLPLFILLCIIVGHFLVPSTLCSYVIQPES